MRRGGAGGEGRLAESAAELAQPPARCGGHSVPVCPPVLALSPPQPVLPNAPLPLQGLCRGLGKNQLTDGRANIPGCSFPE